MLPKAGLPRNTPRCELADFTADLVAIAQFTHGKCVCNGSLTRMLPSRMARVNARIE